MQASAAACESPANIFSGLARPAQGACCARCQMLRVWSTRGLTRNACEKACYNVQEGMSIHRRGVTEDLEALEPAQSRALSELQSGRGTLSLSTHRPHMIDIDVHITLLRSSLGHGSRRIPAVGCRELISVQGQSHRSQRPSAHGWCRRSMSLLWRSPQGPPPLSSATPRQAATLSCQDSLFPSTRSCHLLRLCIAVRQAAACSAEKLY